MKYKNAMKGKIARIEKVFKYEIRSGKCTRQDINFILDTLRMTLEPWHNEDDEEIITDEERAYLYQVKHGTHDPSSLVWTPAQISDQIDLQIERLREDPF
jgi:hypothetical protein